MTNEERAALVEQLRVDVFYGDARLANQKRHNPLHMYAANQIEADGKRIAELEDDLIAASREIVSLKDALAQVGEQNHVD